MIWLNDGWFLIYALGSRYILSCIYAYTHSGVPYTHIHSYTLIYPHIHKQRICAYIAILWDFTHFNLHPPNVFTDVGSQSWVILTQLNKTSAKSSILKIKAKLFFYFVCQLLSFLLITYFFLFKCGNACNLCVILMWRNRYFSGKLGFPKNLKADETQTLTMRSTMVLEHHTMT